MRLGVFALRDFVLGEVVLEGRLVTVVERRTEHSFQVDWDRHVELDSPARLVNHSCMPNTGIRDNGADGYDFIALHGIRAGTEICWDYASTEWESIAVPACACASADCRGASLGFRHLTHEQVDRLGEFIACYLSCRGGSRTGREVWHRQRER
ncbi:SET domain-containing protein-lysine N-methyltransferase [Streptomyces violascens]|uniref:SET domain-containing protein-lysine N-methyltransferase n=1 Tax=Streptomyces violascens TaxID=67381 RepID=UPI003688D479